MSGKSVATEGDVVPTVGTDPTKVKDKASARPAASGTWTARPVSYKSYSQLKINGKKAIHEASCTFDFAGSDSAGNPVANSETVTLSPKSTLLQGASSNVLVNGDSITSTYGNKLEAKTENPLMTS